MKVCVISPFIADGSSIRATLPASRQNILDFIGLVCKEYDFIVLAGYNVNCYPNERDVQSELRKNQSLATTFLETSGMKPRNYSPSNNAFFVSANTICDKPEQIFSKPKKVLPTVLDISILQKNLSQRFHFISNKKILLFICGEIDAFSKNNNNVHHGCTLSWQSADIIINPTFTMRGRWGALGPKLNNLSLNKRIVIHNANNQKNHSATNIISNIRVYFDGGELDIFRYIDTKYKLTWASFEIKEDPHYSRDLHFLKVDKYHKTTNDLIYYIEN